MGDNKNSESPLDPQKILISSNHKYWDVARVSQDLKKDSYFVHTIKTALQVYRWLLSLLLGFLRGGGEGG